MKDQLRQLFEADFQSINRFEEQVITPIFGSAYESKQLPQDLLNDSELAHLAEDAKIIGLDHLGKITIKGGNNIELFDVTVANSVQLSRSRVEIQCIIRNKMMPYTHAFMVFHYEDPRNREWRFSYAYKEDNVANTTDAKRYTYLFGQNHHCRTASERFAKLADLSVITDQAIIDAFSVSALTKEFYNELFKWYEWTLSEESPITFPNLVSNPDDDRDDLDIKMIRLITRIIFVWFIKHKDLVPDRLFDPEYLNEILMGFDPQSMTSGNYYNAILQNLFFATLNCPIIDEDGNSRRFAEAKNSRDVKNLYRYEELFAISKEEVVELFSEMPFLNGGLFECLDKPSKQMDNVDETYAYDGFSRNDRKFSDGRYKHRAFIPNQFFFHPQRGLIPILSKYNFTIEENTPSDQDVALDPELLGHVFENLLGAYNPETGETARNNSGSFYTPREIVNFMVDKSILAYLGNSQTAQDLLDETYIIEPEKSEEYAEIAQKLRTVKILDPACGSGAFPMGLLTRIVSILEKIEPSPALYQLKLEIINNCIFGADIQPIASQISKLRFFISLICEIEKDPSKPNYGIPPLPNLETKFVTADSLIHLKKLSYDTEKRSELYQKNAYQLSLFEDDIYKILDKIRQIRLEHFNANKLSTKKILREKDNALRQQLAERLKQDDTINTEDANKLVEWNPYDQIATADFFDPEWMFGLREGFDIVIGNPPYIQLQKDNGALAKKYQSEGYEAYRRTGDIYSLFYERGYELLKPNGHLCYITSNKWMRAEYGRETRQFFSTKTYPMLLIDFGGIQIFESATVDTNILLFEKLDERKGEKNKGQTLSVVIKENKSAGIINLSDYVKQESVICDFRTSDSWVILSPIEQSIKSKIEAAGTPLKDWGIQINYGIKTGYNTAFIINTEKRDEILANCKNEEERKRTEAIIRP